MGDWFRYRLGSWFCNFSCLKIAAPIPVKISIIGTMLILKLFFYF